MKTPRSDALEQRCHELIDIAVDADWFAPLLVCTADTHRYNWNVYHKPAWVVRSLEPFGAIEQLLRVVGLEANSNRSARLRIATQMWQNLSTTGCESLYEVSVLVLRPDMLLYICKYM